MIALPTAMPPDAQPEILLVRTGTFNGLRVLSWAGDIIYASRGYKLLRAQVPPNQASMAGLRWSAVASFRSTWWRQITSVHNLSARLVRDGFHALAVLPSGGLVAAVPGAIVTLSPGETEFRVTRAITRGTRPLHITCIPNGTILWGEYFDNAARDEVHVYASSDGGATWNVAYTFPKRAIRHIHNIVYDRWQDCIWILTGDYGDECRILRASCDLRELEPVMRGNQQARAVALVPAEDGVYFSSDTPFEINHVYHMDRRGQLSDMAVLGSSSIYGCRVGRSMFFSTMVEPSPMNKDRHVGIYGSGNGATWNSLLAWQKDRWPMKLFQYGNAIFPDGDNRTEYLAVTSIAVESEDLVMSLYSVRP